MTTRKALVAALTLPQSKLVDSPPEPGFYALWHGETKTWTYHYLAPEELAGDRAEHLWQSGYRLTRDQYELAKIGFFP